MKINALMGAAIVLAVTPAAALADDPHDLAMRNLAARARDAEATRRLNQQESAAVRDRALHAWRVVGATGGGDAGMDDATASRQHQQDMDRYARSRAQYEREVADWQQAVAACRAGVYAACDR